MKFNSLLFLLCCAFLTNAQSDWRIAKNTSSLDQVERIVLPEQNNDQLLQAELNRRGPGIAPRFAVTFPMNITPETHGTWDYTSSGKAVWRLRIHSKNAKSLNLGFTKYFMPDGGILVLYSMDQQEITGPFSPADNEDHEQLWTPIFPMDELVVEVQVPIQNKSLLQLELSSINHDFLGFGGVVSGSCNVDVLCGIDDGFPEIEEHRDLIQSVAVIGFNGGTFCTGFLINNARQDCTPYFMTADHCGVNTGNAASLVAYWNFQNSTCRDPGSTASGQNGNGTLNDFNTGAIFRSGSATSDFTLLELDDPVSETADAFMAGWNRGSSAPSSAVCVHHPDTDEKRISFEDDPLMMTNGFGNSPSSNFTHVRVVDWDLGTTEPGSSGSPLFDQNEQVVGQLHGGGAACGNNSSDWYGSFARSWNGGGSSSSRLRDWLDPDDTGIETLDGIEASFCTFAVNPIQTNIESCPNGEAVYTLIASPNFIEDVQLEFLGLPAGVDISVTNNPVPPGDTTYLTISNLGSLTLDDYPFNVNATDGTNAITTTLVLSLIDTPAATNLVTPADGSMNISNNPTYVWEPVPSAAYYIIQIATDDAFSNIIKEETIFSTAYNTGGLSFGNTYYWRVTTINICGETISSTSSFSTALDITVTLSPNVIALCNSETASTNLTIGNNFASAGATLSASGLPAGATISYAENPVQPGSTTNIQISNLEGLATNNYPIVINVDDGTNSNSKTVTLFVEAVPLPVSLNTPANNAEEVDFQPQFLWIPTDGANTYTLEVASDVDFNTIVATTTTNITVYSLPNELDASTTYFWRVISEGDCGTSISETSSFTTIIIDNVTILNNTQIDIRPNPTTGLLNISLSESLPGNLSVEVFSINGQRIIQEIQSGETNFEINLSQFPAGMYLLRLVNAENSMTKRIVLHK